MQSRQFGKSAADAEMLLACFDALSRKQGSCHSLAEAALMMCCIASITLHCCCP